MHLQPVEPVHGQGQGLEHAEAEVDILDIFIEEADDLLENIETAIGRWESVLDDVEPLNNMQRT